MKVISFSTSICLLALWSMSFSYTYPTKGWEHLGSRTVNYKIDRDVIKVGGHEGAFKKLKLKVTGGPLNMHHLVVEYGNGKKEKLNVKHHFTRGSETRLIDLSGNRRVIRNITIWYDTKIPSKHKTKIHVFGKH